MGNCERYIKGQEPKMNEIFDRTTEEIKKIERVIKKIKMLNYYEKAYKRLDLTFDLGMSLILIANILLFMWNNYSVYTAMSIGFVSGLWLANYMYRGLRRL